MHAQHGTIIDFLIGSYFKSLSDGDVPPVKGRFEDVSSVDEGAATKGILQVLHTQVNTDATTPSLVPYSLVLWLLFLQCSHAHAYPYVH